MLQTFFYAASFTLLFTQASLQARELSVRDISYNGSGCPVGTLDVSQLTRQGSLDFNSFYAELSPTSRLRDGRKNCQLSFDLQIPKGYQVALTDFTLRLTNFARGEAQTRLTIRNYVQGSPATSSIRETYAAGNDFFSSKTRVQLPWDELQYTPCNRRRSLQLNLAVQTRDLDRRSDDFAFGFLAIESIQDLSFDLRPCY